MAETFLPDSFVILDLETTGLGADRCRVIEIGMVEVRGSKVTDTYTTLIDPGCPIPSFITGITGIRSEMLRGAPRFEQVAAPVGEFLDRGLMVAHNAPFDFRFISAEFERAGQVRRPDHLCTVRMARRLVPELRSCSLDSLMRHFEIRLQENKRHRALGDALATARIFIQLCRLTLNPDELIGSLVRSPQGCQAPEAGQKHASRRVPDTRSSQESFNSGR
ncbi:MAG: 3'-5' exonuclease [Candidatus Omnitrophica bacterium]|nr:3'-5' exonuclease [Candidatus Omnitrophota bacterium]